MSAKKSLWSRSSAWRWTVAVTLLATFTLILINPWRIQRNMASGYARYTPSAPRLSTKPTIRVQRPSSLTPSGASQTGASAQSDPAAIQAFDLPVSQPIHVYPPDAELHVIGVYEGAPPAGTPDIPWWSKCGSLSPVECHNKHAREKIQRTVDITISRNGPIVLSLMAYEPVLWSIHGEKRDIKGVIIAGYYGQEITGLEPATPVDSYSYKPSICKQCRQHSTYFYAYKKDSREYQSALSRIKQLSGLTPVSFQGAYSANNFSISSSTASAGDLWSATQERLHKDPYTTKAFLDQVKLGGEELPLPEGTWQAIIYNRLPITMGQDELLVLAQSSGSRLVKLMATRLRVSTDGKGFDKAADCMKQTTHASRTDQNTPFGDQLCYWVEHNTDPWSQPAFKLAGSRLADSGITLPSTVLTAGFHSADMNTSITTVYYLNPETGALPALPDSWLTSPWHPIRIKRDADRNAVVKEYLDWASTWFQIFRASRNTG